MKNNYKKLVKYWQETAAYDYDTMKSLTKSRRYASSLFFGHIVLEKILKALVVNETKKHAPYTHDLIKLCKIIGMELDNSAKDFLYEVNKFNLKARYPEYKSQFYKLCTKKYSSEYIGEVDKLYKKLCQRLKPKK
ncbi:MAG: HEPN domain-containing protein [Parcubacteria group bacterium]|nr:HEPN domain-containing protein [Parcubacteria group bacterium]